MVDERYRETGNFLQVVRANFDQKGVRNVESVEMSLPLVAQKQVEFRPYARSVFGRKIRSPSRAGLFTACFKQPCRELREQLRTVARRRPGSLVCGGSVSARRAAQILPS